MNIQEAGEDYLETILILSREQSQVRSIDVANKLGFSKPSVSVYMKQLRENGFVTADAKGYLSLTESGLAIAGKIYERHEIIASLLMKIGVDQTTAYTDACKLEHDMSDATFHCIKKLYTEHFS